MARAANVSGPNTASPRQLEQKVRTGARPTAARAPASSRAGSGPPAMPMPRARQRHIEAQLVAMLVRNRRWPGRVQRRQRVRPEGEDSASPKTSALVVPKRRFRYHAAPLTRIAHPESAASKGVILWDCLADGWSKVVSNQGIVENCDTTAKRRSGSLIERRGPRSASTVFAGSQLRPLFPSLSLPLCGANFSRRHVWPDDVNAAYRRVFPLELGFTQTSRDDSAVAANITPRAAISHANSSNIPTELEAIPTHSEALSPGKRGMSSCSAESGRTDARNGRRGPWGSWINSCVERRRAASESSSAAVAVRRVASRGSAGRRSA